MAQRLTGIEYLGCMYNIYGYYASRESVGKPLCYVGDAPDDTTEAIYNSDDAGEYSYPSSAVTLFKNLEGDYSLISYEKIEELHETFALKAHLEGSQGLFSAEIEARYEQESTSSSSYYHVEVTGYIPSYVLRVKLEYLRDNLLPKVKDDLYQMNADELVKRYGTHFLYEAEFGGRWTYSQSASKTTYKSRQEAEYKVKAKYDEYKASSEGSYSKDTSQEENLSERRISAVGGLPQMLDTNYDTWSQTIDGNFALVDFTENSLMRISELVIDNDSRKQEIDTAIDNALKQGRDSLTTGSVSQSFYNGSDDVEVDVALDKGKVAVGFAARVDGDGDVTRVALEWLDLATGERGWQVEGDRSSYNQKDYETFGSIPDGNVLTGIALSGNKHNFTAMALYYKQFRPDSTTETYLDPAETPKKLAFERDEDDNSDRKYESELKTDGAIVGIGIGYSGGDKGKMDRLKLYHAPIVKNEDSITLKRGASNTVSSMDNPDIVRTSRKSKFENYELEYGCDSEKVMVGFAGTIKSKSDFTRIAICELDLSTNERQWVVTSIDNDGEYKGIEQRFSPSAFEAEKSKFERVQEVPDGFVLTGIGLREKSDTFKNMVLYYQRLTSEAANNYLDPEILTLHSGKWLDSYEVEYTPQENYVMVGIKVGAYDGNVERLSIDRAKLEE